MEHTWEYQGTAPVKIKKFLSSLGMGHRMFNDLKKVRGSLLVDGRSVRPTTKILPHQPLTVKMTPAAADPAIKVSMGPLAVIYEDENWLVVNKPAGIASMPGPTTGDDTLLNRIVGYLTAEHSPELRPHLMTRLDHDTSGVLLVAKHRVATSMISSQVESHQLGKTYFALVTGGLNQDHGVIDAPIKRVAGQRARVVDPSGQPARTEYWVLDRSEQWTAVRVRLQTGRTHQIRVHFAHLGHPLLGDQLYGQSSKLINRQALHASSIAFHDPFSQKEIKERAPLPDDLVRLVGPDFSDEG